MLEFLRGFFGVCNVNNSPLISISHETFTQKTIENNKIYSKKKFFNIQPLIKLPEIPRYKSQPRLGTKLWLVKDVKKIVNRDHKDIIKWTPGVNSFKTLYQDTYHGKSSQYVARIPKDLYTSSSIKLMPDRSFE